MTEWADFGPGRADLRPERGPSSLEGTYGRISGNSLLCPTHATGEAFIDQEKLSVIMESGLGLRKVYLITSYQNENFFTSKFF